MRNKAGDFEYGEKPLAFGAKTTFGFIEADSYIYLGEWYVLIVSSNLLAPYHLPNYLMGKG